MEENKKARKIRYGLILLITVFLCFVFYISYAEEEAEVEEKVVPHVEVLVNEDEGKHPVVAIAKKVQKDNVLILYNVLPEDRYKFEMVAVKKLNVHPKELVGSSTGIGVWALLNKEWVQFDENLNENKKESKLEYEPKNYNLEVYETESGEFESIVKQGEQTLWEYTFLEKPTDVHLLSKQKDHWIVVFQEDILIYKNEEKN